MKALFNKFFGTSRSSRQSRKASRSDSRPAVMERLEERQFMSVTLPVPSHANAAPAAVHADQAAFAPGSCTLNAEISASEDMPVFTVTNVSGSWGSANTQLFFRIDGEVMLGYMSHFADGSYQLGAAARAEMSTTAAAHHVGATITRVDPGVAPPPAATGSEQFAIISGGLWEHVGTNRNANWFKIWDTGVAQISASQRMPDTVFVLFNTGALYEHIGRDKNSGWFQLWATGVKQISAGTQISAGQPQANTVFVLFNTGALYEHIGTASNSGWFNLFNSGVTQISASQGQADTVFASFNGAVWEHTGRSASSGWTKVWDTGAVQISADSAQSDTVFVIFNGGALYEHTGLDKSLGWSKLWSTGVVQVSAAPSQMDTEFVLFNTGALYEHTGLDANSGWSKLWDTGVTQITAAVDNDTVLANFNGALWQHAGKDRNSGWFKIWDTAVSSQSAGGAA